MNIETTAIHAGHTIDPVTGAVTPPIYLSTTFEREADGTYPHGFIYTRDNNPNRLALEKAITAMEGGYAAAAFASGSVATMSLLQALSPGDHLLAPNDFYFGIRQIIKEVFVPWGLQVTFVDMANLAEVGEAIRPNTRMLMVETPSNPLLTISSLPALAELAHGAGAYLMVDNTVATPVLQQPFRHGADFVVHATTKYLSGHSDILGGLVVAGADSPLWQKLVYIQKVGGAVPSPFDCWLALRGIQTLPWRVRAHAANAMQVAQFLAGHPAVERVNYPGLPDHPGHAIARAQMSGFGGLFSVQVQGGQAEAMAVAAKVKLFTRATSFGGTHSLIEHRASVEAPGTQTPVNLLRLSIGLENAADLIEDLAQALG
jgi:cystathionine gamma-synthase